MQRDIENHINLATESIAWAKKFGKETFPVGVFKEYRRQLKRISRALSDNCSAAAYGESQVGKSYLMSSLLSSPGEPFVITNAGRTYSFIDEINPSGGNNTKIESTGVITRFTLRRSGAADGMVRVSLLSVVDLVLLLADSYYNDIRVAPGSVLKYDEINDALGQMGSLWSDQSVAHAYIDEDDIKDICDYIRDIIGSAATGVVQSDFCSIVSPVIQYVSPDRWVDVFSLLWNRNSEISSLFSLLIREYGKLHFASEVCVPFDAVLRSKGSLLQIDWLDSVCGLSPKMPEGTVPVTDVCTPDGTVLARNFGKGNLSALAAEITFEVPAALASDRRFLEKIDLLDFPGARSREKFKEAEIHDVLPKVMRRGKVAYLFNKYSRSLRISSVLLCHHNDMKAQSTIDETVNTWIESSIGETPAQRGQMLKLTGGIAPLFFIATKFNLDLERTKNDTPATTEKLALHWNRFDTVIPEIITSRWLTEWASEPGASATPFQNVYPLRDFYWSGKNQVFDGYSDGAQKSAETSLHHFADYPDYFDRLRQSFLQNDFVRKHFANPERTWNSVATVNNDGSKAIIENLNAISTQLDHARRTKYLTELNAIKQNMHRALAPYFEPEDDEAKNRRVAEIASDIKLSLTLSVGGRPEIFGRIIDALMVPVGDLRSIAYDIIVCHTDEPKDFSQVNFVRKLAGIDPTRPADENGQRLHDYFGCDLNLIDAVLKQQYGCSVDDVLSAQSETLTTVADVVSKHIADYWRSYLNQRVPQLKDMLPHADEVVLMLTSLFKKLGIQRLLSERIDRYCKVFSIGEQPNAIADYASLTLNNFVSTAGRSYMKETENEVINAKAAKCGIRVDLSPQAWTAQRRPQPLTETLAAFDNAADIDKVDIGTLTKLPLWDSFLRWQNLVTVGLLCASDISQTNPEANAEVKRLMTELDNLYKQ